MQKDKHQLLDINITHVLKYSFVSVIKALKYTLFSKNVVNTLLLPGMLAMAILYLATVCRPSATLAPILDWAVLISFLLLLMGYGWRLIHILRKDGYDAPAPDWTLRTIVGSIWDGLKIAPLISAVLFASILTIGAISREITSDRGSTQLVTPADLTEEIEVFSQQIRLNPKDAGAYANRGTAYDKLGQNQKAIEDYSQAIILDSKDAEIYVQRGRAYFELGQYQKAFEDYSRAIILKPQNLPNLFDTSIGRLLIILVTAPCFALIPFVWGAIVQSAQKRSLLQLMNFSRTWQAGKQCYGKSLLVSLVVLVFFPVLFITLPNYFLFISPWVLGRSNELYTSLMCLLGPIFVVLTFTSFHMIAQAYDDYWEDNLPVEKSAYLTAPEH